MDWSRWTDPESAYAEGRALRDALDHDAHRDTVLAGDRPGVVAFVEESNRGRVPELLQLRIARMIASPFAFFRGAAGLMARDLAAGPASGIDVQLCGDAHAANVGLFGRQDGQVVVDFNDFDETVPGPWEWDLKRLATSLILAGRSDNDLSERQCRTAVVDMVRTYRTVIGGLAEQPFLDSWYALGDDSVLSKVDTDDLRDNLAHAAAKARKNTSAKAAAKWTRRNGDGTWRFTVDPPVLTDVEPGVEAAVIAALDEYAGTLQPHLRALLGRYAVCDVAFRVVGTGSVGLRNYLVLLRGNGDEPLILQVKEAKRSALAPFLGTPSAGHEGERVVTGARLMQADADVLLGWTTIEGRPYIVRQFRNRKGKIDPAALSGEDLDDYGRLAGGLLARAHARTVDARVLAGYCEGGKDLDGAVVGYAADYADQTERDHAELARAVEEGELEAHPEA